MTNNINITLSENAITKIAKLLSETSGANFLRISVEGGGCSGFQYKYDFVSKKNPDDLVLNETLVIDPISVDLMNNSVIDYVETLGSAEFSIKNPNSTSRCGCGNSFSV